MKAKWISFVAMSVVLAACAATVGGDPPPPTLWTSQIGGGGNERAQGIAVDGSGNSYITGHTTGDLGGPNQGWDDVFIVKSDSGGAVQWASQIGSSESDRAYGIAVASSGNIYITGNTLGHLGGPNQGEYDAFIVACDSSGIVQWTRQIGSRMHDLSYAISLDDSGNIYITGGTYGDLGGPNQGGVDVFVTKYDSGGTLQWIRQMGSSEHDYANAIAVDAGGNTYITGSTEGDLGGPNQGGFDAFMVKHDSAGTLQWARQFGTGEWDSAQDIGLDANGNIYITGYTSGDLGGPNQGWDDVFIVACHSGGTVQWMRQIGSSESDRAYGIAVASSGNIYITGWTGGDLGGPNQGSRDAFIVAIGATPAEVALDIKPGSWPNPFNPVSKGVLPLAVCGSDEFDVMTIDPDTILLGREGVDGLVPLRWSYEDVGTPFGGEPCDGHDLNGDGFMDLALKFSTQELMSTLGLGDLAGQTVPLLLTGSLLDGTPLEGIDWVWVLRRGDGNMDGLVDGLDYIAWSNHYRTGAAWSEGDYTGDGYVDGLDYVAWSNNYKLGCPAAVPEPATLALLGLGALALIHRRRHKA